MGQEIIEGYLTVNAAVVKFGVTPKTIMNWCQKGTIRSIRVGCHYYVPEDAVPEPMPCGRPRGNIIRKKEEEKCDKFVPFTAMPKCPSRTCFNNWDGRCTGLKKCLYDKEKHTCPFYKFVGDYHG